MLQQPFRGVHIPEGGWVAKPQGAVGCPWSKKTTLLCWTASSDERLVPAAHSDDVEVPPALGRILNSRSVHCRVRGPGLLEVVEAI
jgi:hypothetical protein